jgi:hypothetical protein
MINGDASGVPEDKAQAEYVGLKRTRNSNTDRSRRTRVAGLERLCFILDLLQKDGSIAGIELEMIGETWYM